MTGQIAVIDEGPTAEQRRRFTKAFDAAMAEPWVQSHAPEPAGGSPDDETPQGGTWEPEA